MKHVACFGCGNVAVPVDYKNRGYCERCDVYTVLRPDGTFRPVPMKLAGWFTDQMIDTFFGGDANAVFDWWDRAANANE